MRRLLAQRLYGFRWDHALSGDRPFGGTTVGVPRDKNAVSLGLNLIYVF